MIFSYGIAKNNYSFHLLISKTAVVPFTQIIDATHTRSAAVVGLQENSGVQPVVNASDNYTFTTNKFTEINATINIVIIVIYY